MRNKMGVLLTTVLLCGCLCWIAFTPTGTTPALADSEQTGGWELVLLPSPQSTYAIDMLNSTEGWAGGAAGFMFHFDGQWWGAPTTFASVINAIDMVDVNNAWAVTWQGEFVHWDGEEWSIMPGTPDVGVLDDIYMLNAMDGWAVGGGGTILRYNGTNWYQVTSPVGIQLKSVDMLDANDGWAVGLSGTVVRWNGNAWLGGSLDTLGWSFYDVDIVSHSDVWAVGGGGMIYHYTTAGWQEVTSPTDHTLRSIVMTSSDDGWAVGEDGVIIHYTGSAWELVDSPTTMALHDLDAVSADDLWAVGRIGVAVHYSPSSPPDLGQSALAVDKRSASPGDILNYTLTVSNTGTGPATSVVFSDTLDLEKVTLVPESLHTSQGTPYEGNPLRVDVGEVAAGAAVTITFGVEVQDLGAPSWFVPNHAIIGADGVYLERSVITTIGTPFSTYLPIVRRSTEPAAY